MLVLPMMVMPIAACVWTRRVMSLQAITFCTSMAAT